MDNYKNYYDLLTDNEKKNSPKELFFSGDFSLLEIGRRVSVVGSRNVSDLGKKRVERIVDYLVDTNITIVSGLAQGVDTIAHEKAILKGGKTIAVIGTSLDRYYPKENQNLQDLIAKEHLLLSQFPQNYPTTGKNFPIRNRTMALISDATIIIEASEKSGTKHQGWEALRLGRRLLIMENVVKDHSIGWAKEMVEYGAEILTSENYKEIINNIHYLTSKEDYAF